MDMFGIGTGELILLAVIALVVLGPEKFPEFAKIAMRAFKDLRGYVDDIKSEMAQELKPVQREMQQLAQHDPEQYIDKLSQAMSAVDGGDDEKKADDASSKTDDASPKTGDASPKTGEGGQTSGTAEQGAEAAPSSNDSQSATPPAQPGTSSDTSGTSASATSSVYDD